MGFFTGIFSDPLGWLSGDYNDPAPVDPTPEKTSIPFDGGGDTHIHSNRDESFTVTERLPGGWDDHYTYSDRQMSIDEANSKSEYDRFEGFRALFGDDNKKD